MLYCASAFQDILNKKYAQKKLLQIQRGYAHRTVSTDAALVIAGIIPLHLSGLQAAGISDIKRNRKSDFENIRFDCHHPVSFLTAGHPGTHHEHLVTEDCDQNHTYKIYTDGSRFNDGEEGASVGCAYVVYCENKEISFKLFKLAPNCSVFQAELLAINEAVKWCVESKHSARIHSDSQAALHSINNRYNLNPISAEIREYIQGNGNHICMCWVRGHIGTLGNERADLLAKSAAASQQNYSYSKSPASYVKAQIGNLIIRRWNDEWVQSTKGAITKELFFPTVHKRLQAKHFSPSFILTQFLTGHGKFGSYFMRFNVITDRNHVCRCQLSPETVKHVLFDCPAFERRRFNLKLHASQCDITYSNSCLHLFSKVCCFREFIDFITYIHDQL